MSAPPEWLRGLLACPRHHVELIALAQRLDCPQGCSFPVVDGVPVLLCEELPATIGIARASIDAARNAEGDDSMFLRTLGISDAERAGIQTLVAQGAGSVDPAVSFLVGATNGNAYAGVRGSLPRLPVPRWPFEAGGGKLLLDIGCNWGRWCFSAAAAGYRPVGVDPSLGAVLAGARTARRLGREIGWVVADARRLPFAAGSADVAFSYSVLQHFADADVGASLGELRRVVRGGGTTWIQMATRYGLRNLQQQARRRFRPPRDFEVRYRGISALLAAFDPALGPSRIIADCFFGLGLRAEDRDLMRPLAVAATTLSAALCRASLRLPLLSRTADSVFVVSRVSQACAAKAA